MGANVLRVALVIGALIDFFVAIVVMFFPQASAALFDIPAQDPTAALLGGGFLLVIDTLARTMTATEIPLGILTALVGTPFFIWLLASVSKTWA